MKRKEIKNRNLMSALTIGISAMMALSTPITAYASDPAQEAPEPTPTEPTTEQTSSQEAVQVQESVTESAQEQADVVQEAATEAAESALNEATEAAETILQGNEEAGIPPITDDEAGTIVDQAVEDLAEAAKEIVEDQTDAGGNVDESAATHLQEASDSMDAIREDLKAADTANNNADAAAQEMATQGENAFENATQATQVSQDMIQDTKDAQQKADEIVEAINNASSVAEAEAAYKQLEDNIADTETSLADKKAYYDRLMDNYEKAKAELRKAEEALGVYEKAYSRNLDEAYAKAQTAEEDIAAAQAKVDNLSKAIDHVEDELMDEVKEAELAAEAFDNVTASDWGQQRELMKSTVENYIIPQLEGKNITDVSWERVPGFDRQDNNYCAITYKVDGVSVTRYFNYDRINRSDGPDRYSGSVLGGAWGIAVYEKSAEEIEADNFLRAVYANDPAYYKNHIPGKPDATDGKTLPELRARANQGEFDVFSFVNKQGQKVMMTRPMLDEAIQAGDIIREEDGKLKTSEGVEVKMIVQNSNSLIHQGNAYLIANESDVTVKHKKAILNALKLNHSEEEAQKMYDAMVVANSNYHAYLNEARAVINDEGVTEHVLAQKYERYGEAVDKAQAAVDQAKDEAEKLTGAIDELKETRKSRKVLAVDVLKVDDIATYLGIQVSAERAQELNNMTVQEALDALDDYLKAANENLEIASENLDNLKQQYKDAEQALEAARERNKPSGGGAELYDQDGDSSGSMVAGDIIGGVRRDAPAGGAGAAIGGGAGTGAGAGAGAAQQVSGGAGTVSQTAGGGAGLAGGGAGGAGDAEAITAEGGQNVAPGESTEIVDEAVALEDSLSSGADVEQAEAETSTIEDDETARASMPVPKPRMSWWWALVILILGERGREIYAKFQEEKSKK
jgi:hypothetical protein